MKKCNKCNKCKILKDISEFSPRKNDCKKCRSHDSKKYYHNNKEQISEKKKEHRKSNKEKIKIAKQKYYKENKEKISEKQKKYNDKNKEKIKKARRKSEAIKIKNDPGFKLHKNVGLIIRISIKKEKGLKRGKSLAFLPFDSWAQLKHHLEQQFEPWMNWDNHGIYDSKTWDDNDSSTWTWQIDHIIPKSDLLYDSMEHPNFKKCWALSNLRPYSSKQNLLDGVNRTRHKK